MTPAELLALPDAEVNARLAEAMGWTPDENIVEYWREAASGHIRGRPQSPPAYCSSLDLCAAVEAEIARRGKSARDAYIIWLDALTIARAMAISDPVAEQTFALIIAPATIRARAALAVLEDQP